MAILVLGVNLATAFWATLSFTVYLAIYTPLKPVSSLSTLVGAVSGALPPLLGWLGACGGLDAGALDLFFVLYFWQIPHFLAIAWKYRDQYRRAGFRLYTAADPTGHTTGFQALLYALALLPVSLLMTWHGLTGVPFLLGAFALGMVLIGASAAFALNPAPATTRRLFVASIGYLPLLLMLMIVDQWLG
jgi:protoheme IX farnesyltransferase